jgi:hypothetical protein
MYGVWDIVVDGGCISGHWGAVIFAAKRGCSGMFEMIDDLQDRCEY